MKYFVYARHLLVSFMLISCSGISSGIKPIHHEEMLNKGSNKIANEYRYCERVLKKGPPKILQISFTPQLKCDDGVRYVNYLSGRDSVVYFLSEWAGSLREKVANYCLSMNQNEFGEAISSGFQPTSIEVRIATSEVIVHFTYEGFYYDISLSIDDFSPKAINFWQ
jgi:hypothetical protein